MSQDSPQPGSPVDAEIITAPTMNAPVPQPMQIIIKQQGLLSRFWSWIGWTGFLLCLMALLSMTFKTRDYFNTTGGIQEKYHSGDKRADAKIAIIRVTGAIGRGDGYVKHQIDRVRADENVKGIVLRVDSPGGTVTGSDFIYHHLTRLREERQLPIVVSMGGMAASGGYYVSMAVGDQEKSIYAEPTTVTGSIGVILPHYDVSGLMEDYRVKDDSIRSHPRKQMLAMTRAIPDDHRALLQAHVNSTLDRFISIVKSGRPSLSEGEGLRAGELDLATGEIFTPDQAKTYGLIDEIGFIEDAIERVCEIQGLELSEVRVVKFDPPPSLFGLPTISAASQHSSGPASLLRALESTAPRTYFLCSSLPPLMTIANYGRDE